MSINTICNNNQEEILPKYREVTMLDLITQINQEENYEVIYTDFEKNIYPQYLILKSTEKDHIFTSNTFLKKFQVNQIILNLLTQQINNNVIQIEIELNEEFINQQFNEYNLYLSTNMDPLNNSNQLQNDETTFPKNYLKKRFDSDE